VTTCYQVTHRTTYVYGEQVEVGHTVAHLRPRELDHQHVESAAVDVEPGPAFTRESLDAFGNHVTYVAVEQAHDRLEVVGRSRVEVTARPLPTEPWASPWEDAVAATDADCSRAGLLARECRLGSPRVDRHPDLAAFAATAFTPGRPLGEAAAELTTTIFEDFEFLPGTTDVTTPVLQVLSARRGVCQDFAHLLLGALRSLGLGARYVSGYIETEPPPGEARLSGADASHAWVGVYVPGTVGGDGQGGAWVDLDPTNGLVQPDRHVTIGWGRDFTDVVPVRGVLYGPPADQSLTISVDVVRCGSPP
jgi:transglutaminase-like putative cysteine protease